MEDKRLAANPSGLCMCGCGRKTKIVTKSDRRHGHVMGQPFRFIHGHSRPAAKGPNRFKLRRRTAVIFLERRDGTVLECLVSRTDFHRVRRHHWYANKNGRRASYAGLALKKGYPPEFVEVDPEFSTLRSNPNFEKLVKEYSRKSKPIREF